MEIRPGPPPFQDKWFVYPNPASAMFIGPFDNEDDAGAVTMTEEQAVNTLNKICSDEFFRKRLEIWIRSRGALIYETP